MGSVLGTTESSTDGVGDGVGAEGVVADGVAADGVVADGVGTEAVSYTHLLPTTPYV